MKRLPFGRVYDLGQPYRNGMPQSPYHPTYHLSLVRRHGDSIGADGTSAAADLLVLGTHVGTHIDALSHVSHGGKLHGGVDAAETQRGGSFGVHGADDIGVIVARGILLDVAGLRGVEALGPAEVVTAADLERAAARAGVGIEPGDVVLLRTGWTRHLDDPARYVGEKHGVPGPDVEAASWLAERRVRATGSDTIAFEVRPPAHTRPGHPVHKTLLVDHGIPIIEALSLDDLARDGANEFLFVAAPLPLVGATGAPVRPLALV